MNGKRPGVTEKPKKSTGLKKETEPITREGPGGLGETSTDGNPGAVKKVVDSTDKNQGADISPKIPHTSEAGEGTRRKNRKGNGACEQTKMASTLTSQSGGNSIEKENKDSNGAGNQPVVDNPEQGKAERVKPNGGGAAKNLIAEQQRQDESFESQQNDGQTTISESSSKDYEQLQSQTKDQADTIETNKKQVEKLEKDMGELMNTNATLNQEVSDAKKQVEKLEKDMGELRNTNATLNQEFSDVKKQSEDRMIEINELRRLETEKDDIQRQQKETIQQRDATIEWLERENKTTLQKNIEAQNKLRERAKQIKQFEQVIREKDITIESMTGEYKDLKERFGKVAGAKMKHDNPDIINLGDKHRSTKVADEYNALYNDAWTDAQTALTDSDKLSDEKATQILLDVLKDCHAFCQKEADNQFDALKGVLFNPIQSVQECSKLRPEAKVSPPTITTLREVRKEISIEATEQVNAVYMKHVENNSAYGKDFVTLTRPYLEKCVEVCWSMVLNLPPLYMEFDVKVGTKVDTNLFTKRSPGDTVKALVWPPLFNGKGGGLLNKGTIEAMKTFKKTTTPKV